MSSVRSTAVNDAAGSGGGSATDSSRTAVGSPARRFLAALVAVVGAGVLLIAGANYFLDPLHFSASGQRQVAAALLSGRTTPCSTRTWIFAGLRREAIAQMTRTPQVHSVRGSRFELATPDLFSRENLLQRLRPQRRVRDLVAFPGCCPSTSACRGTSC